MVNEMDGQTVVHARIRSPPDSYNCPDLHLTVPLTNAQAFSACVTVEWVFPSFVRMFSSYKCYSDDVDGNVLV